MCRALALLAAFLFFVTGATGQDTTIKGVLLGTPPPGLQAVLDAVNAKLKADLGVRLEVLFLGWNEVNTKYPLMLDAGEGVDWIYTASWGPYTTQAVRGAFRELTPAMIQKWMPRHWKATPAEAWDQVRIKGKIFMVPTSTPDRKIPLAVIRGDLRKKYGLAPVTRFQDIEAYLAAVKANEPRLVPINLGNGYDIGQPFFALLNPLVPPLAPALVGTVFGNYEDPGRRMVNLLEEPFLTAYRATALTVKRWYDRGYINRAPFANTVLSKHSFAQGRSAVGFGNSQDIQQVLAQAVAQGYDPELIPILSSTGHAPADNHAGNGVAIAATSKNGEKALQVLDLLMEEPGYNRLVYFGIEGKNYVVTDGKLGLPPGVLPDQNTYPQDAAGFWFTNKDQFPPQAGWTPQYIELRKRLKDVLVVNRFADFTSKRHCDVN